MQIEIDPLSDVPLYQQLRDRVVEGIAEGALSAGDPLASVRQLALEFGINVATVAKGYDLLRAEGLVRTHRASGSLVARDPHAQSHDAHWSDAAVASWTARLRTLLAEGSAQGLADADMLTRAQSILSEFQTTRAAHAIEREASAGAGDGDANAHPTPTRKDVP